MDGESAAVGRRAWSAPYHGRRQRPVLRQSGPGHGRESAPAGFEIRALDSLLSERIAYRVHELQLPPRAFRTGVGDPRRERRVGTYQLRRLWNRSARSRIVRESRPGPQEVACGDTKSIGSVNL